MIRHILIILLLVSSFGLYAQKQDSVRTLSVAPNRVSVKNLRFTPKPVSIKTKRVAQKSVSLKELKVSQKPDSVKGPRILKQWTLSTDFSEEVNVPFDTVFSLFNRFKIADKYSPINATLGNYGLPFYQINFFDRITDPDKFLYSYYYPFMHVSDKALFMNTQIPFTELVWTFAGPRERAEQTFRVRHSQNVNRFFNFGLIYDIIFCLGQYSYQRAEDKTFTLYSSYTGVKYKFYFAAGINNLTSYENGGIIDKKELSKFVSSKIRDVPVRLGGLDKANSILKNRNLLLVQRYTIGGNPITGTFSHIFTLESNKRTYSDAYPISGFYDTILINKTVTFDSLYSRSVKNTLRFDFTTDETRKYRLGGGVGIRNELFRYSQIVPTPDTMLADTVVWNRSNNVLIGRLYNNIGDKFRWLAYGELYFTGYRAGDFNLNGEISKSFDWKKGQALWLITGSMINRRPSFWYEQWGSNHFEWHNNFNKEFTIEFGSAFTYPARNIAFRFNYVNIKDYIDFDTSAFPSQYLGNISVAAFTMRKGLRVWKFHLDADVIIQKSNQSGILNLPLVTVRSAGYFEHHFIFKKTGGKLSTQLGVDVTYNTLYKPYSYMPATGRFYRQYQSSAGDYPFINIFLNLKIKRTRLFLMYDHLNSGKTGYNYDMIPSYPMNVRMFRFGAGWTFYN